MEYWILFCSFVGAVAGAAISAYMTGRLGESGKIDASLNKLDRLEQQVGVLTTKTEGIKTELASKEWDRQWILQQKRESYLAALGVARTACTWLRLAHQASLDSGQAAAGLEGILAKIHDAETRLLLFGSPTMFEAFSLITTALEPASEERTRLRQACEKSTDGYQRMVRQIRQEFGQQPIRE